MSSKMSQWIGLIGIAATIPLVQTVATAKSAVEIAETARTITVLITSPSGQGSGVILKHEGDVYTVLTAAHVVKKKVTYKITTPDDRQYEVISSSIKSAPGDIDLAVVKFKATTKYPIAKLGNCNILTRGMDLYVSGFPAKDRAITSTILVVREGKISANSNKTFNKGYSLIYSNNTLNGMSGGAVLNSKGELVAIHGVGNRDDDGRQNGYNLGIPIERFGTVASRMGVELSGQVAAIPSNTAPKADDYFASAFQKNEKGDYQGAVADYNRAISIDPNYALAYNNRGILKNDKLNDTPGAVADYNRAISIDPNYANAYNNRGIVKNDKLNDTPGAVADYNRAIQIKPNHADAYYNRGNLKRDKLNDTPGALADYNRAIQIKPNYANAYGNRGNLKRDKLNDALGALADYNRVMQINPNDALAYNNRGVLKQAKLNDNPGALADFNRTIQIDPNLAPAYINRGNLKNYKLNDTPGALADYNRAIQINPDLAEAHGNRGLLKYEKLNDRAGAISDMKQAAKLFQKQGRTQDYQKAIGFLKKWQQTSGN